MGNTLYFIEEKREEAIPILVAKIQAYYRGMIARRYVRKLRAAYKIALYWKHRKYTAVMSRVLAVFEGVGQDPSRGKGLMWPQETPKALETLGERIRSKWW